MDILSLNIQIERDLDIYKHLSQLRKACGTVRNTRKAYKEHAGFVCLGSYSAMVSIIHHLSQGHSPAGLLMGLTVGTVTITMGQNAGASMNPAADVMPRSEVIRMGVYSSKSAKGGSH